MDFADFRNLMREWVRNRAASDPRLAQLPLVVPNEASGHPPTTTYLRYSLQMGEAAVIGVGTLIKRRRRVGRLFVEVFTGLGEGEGEVSALATRVEAFLRAGSETAGRPHDDVTLFEPSTFDRPEGGRYCQVVSARLTVDLFS